MTPGFLRSWSLTIALDHDSIQLHLTTYVRMPRQSKNCEKKGGPTKMKCSSATKVDIRPQGHSRQHDFLIHFHQLGGARVQQKFEPRDIGDVV